MIGNSELDDDIRMRLVIKPESRPSENHDYCYSASSSAESDSEVLMAQ
jgi:hypothetical protein